MNFKRVYSDILGDQNRSVVLFVNSASAQVFADVALCPFEAVKVQVQIQPKFFFFLFTFIYAMNFFYLHHF